MRRCACLAILTAALLAACSAPPERPALSVPQAYFSAVPGPLDQAALAEWWHAFDDPQLTALVRTAMTRNWDVQGALAQLRLARARLRQSRAALFPVVDTPGSARRQWLDAGELGETLGLGDRPELDTWQLALQASWEPDLFGAGAARSSAAALDVAAAQAGVVAARLAVASNTAQAYVQWRALQGQRAALLSAIEAAAGLEKVAKARFSLGDVTRIDVEAAAAEHASAQARLGEIDAALAQTGFALDTLTDQPPGTAATQLAAPAPVPTGPDAVAGGQPLDLLRRRPDVIAAVAQLEAGQLQALASRRDLFPKIGLTAAAGRSGFALGSISSASDLLQIGASLTFPWLDFGARRAAIDLADAQADSRYVSVRQALAQALQDVETAYGRIAARGPQVDALQRTLAHRREAYRMARVSYEEGEVDLTVVLDAQVGELEARQQLLQAGADLALARIALFTALGGGWRTEGGDDGARAVSQALADDPVPDRMRSPSPGERTAP